LATRHAVPRLREAAQFTGEPLLPLRGRQAFEQGADGLHPWPHRRRPVAFEAAAPDDQRALPARDRGGLLEQARLAHAGFALDEYESEAAGERGLQALSQNPELVDAADRAVGRLGVHIVGRIGNGSRRPDRTQHPLMCGLQGRPGADAEFLGEPGANRPEHRQRLALLPGGGQRGDEARLHWFVERCHRRGTQ
jgi:hypothetical protein